jgi:hypothetical protein
VGQTTGVSSGHGSGGADFGETEGLVGPKPRFELSVGWLTLFPTDGWTQSLPLFCFEGFVNLDMPQMRDLKSYSLYVGEALQNTMRVADTFRFSLNRACEFSYSVARNSDTILRAGSVSKLDDGGRIAVWQERDRPYVTARINDRVFHLVDGQDAEIDPHYVFLARLTQPRRGIGFIPPQAVCSAGDLNLLRKELIRDAAHQLTAPKTKIL